MAGGRRVLPDAGGGEACPPGHGQFVSPDQPRHAGQGVCGSSLLIAAAATLFEATTLEVVATTTEFELRRGPVRLAHWRLLALDRLLQELEEIRLSGDGCVPPDVRAQIVTFAERHDPVLSDMVASATNSDLNGVHDALFDAQGRVMVELSELRRTPSWEEVERLFNASDEYEISSGRASGGWARVFW
jgi:hypothetical protein